MTRWVIPRRPVMDGDWKEFIDPVKTTLNHPGFTGGQNFRRIARYGTDIK
jgi:hypothetical protein